MHLVQILNEEPRDSLVIVTNCRVRALACYIFIKLSKNAQMPPQQIKAIIEEFRNDPKNSDFGITLTELVTRLQQVDTNNEEWKSALERVQNLC
ncbi:hypothetical protein TcasGA2_TC006671 [Tribolium castaneum]|uniref:Uncharacterized protein n=1 Tax=Tribolium castaneum TaxID=7070 RepID=D6WYE1_TRICA|nr:hypothetical protein TcasGA2_TC006671 [Tribolium castaneum]